MLILRSLQNLTKLQRDNVTIIKCALIRRELRRAPSQTLEVPAAIAAEPHTLEGKTEKELQHRLQENDGTAALELRHDTALGIPAHNRRAVHAENEKNPLAVLDILDYDKKLLPTFNLAAYVNKSTTLQQLVQLGVDLHSIERRKGLADFVLRLDFDQHVKPSLLFLRDQGVPADAYGELITKNPLIFKVDLDDLQVRVNYLEVKKFTAPQRQRIFTLNPFWLMYPTPRIDRRLGHFQKEFDLSGDDVRFLASKQPRLITYHMQHVNKATFCIREEMGFDADEIKCLLLSKPRLWMQNSDKLVERFAYAHHEMKLSHDMMLQCPEVLTSREYRLQQRHEFLKMLGRAQYDPAKDLYISPKVVVSGDDYDFVRDVAKSDMKTFELFLKTR